MWGSVEKMTPNKATVFKVKYKGKIQNNFPGTCPLSGLTKFIMSEEKTCKYGKISQISVLR